MFNMLSEISILRCFLFLNKTIQKCLQHFFLFAIERPLTLTLLKIDLFIFYSNYLTCWNTDCCVSPGVPSVTFTGWFCHRKVLLSSGHVFLNLVLPVPTQHYPPLAPEPPPPTHLPASQDGTTSPAVLCFCGCCSWDPSCLSWSVIDRKTAAQAWQCLCQAITDSDILQPRGILRPVKHFIVVHQT